MHKTCHHVEVWPTAWLSASVPLCLHFKLEFLLQIFHLRLALCAINRARTSRRDSLCKLGPMMTLQVTTFEVDKEFLVVGNQTFRCLLRPLGRYFGDRLGSLQLAVGAVGRRS